MPSKKSKPLREQYAECKDIPQERHVVIDKFLDEASKDYEIEQMLWKYRDLKNKGEWRRWGGMWEDVDRSFDFIDGEDEFLEVGAQLELHGSIIHDYTQRLDALPPTLFEGYDRDLRELYTRSREVRDEIFSQRYRLRSLEQEMLTVTFGDIWRPMLALES
ncbi:hypothetical protein Tco_1525703 [Tanacetum coccineum]